jgi:hypothetical protein
MRPTCGRIFRRRSSDNSVLSNAEFIRHLPPSWGTLCDLTSLDEETLAAAAANGWMIGDDGGDPVTRPAMVASYGRVIGWSFVLAISSMKCLIALAQGDTLDPVVYEHNPGPLQRFAQGLIRSLVKGRALLVASNRIDRNAGFPGQIP